MDTDLRVVLTIDVEEEGLFGGAYARNGVSVRNVAWLARLAPLLQRMDMPVTLLCAHSVFADADACRALDALRSACRAEIGAHLHHWNTPPVTHAPSGTAYESAGQVPVDRMRAKLRTLFQAGEAYAGHPLTSFRMGRWDLHRWHWSLLAECGVLVDASVRPLHCGRGGPNHFFASSQPYMVHIGAREILEVPLTCVPVFPALRTLFAAERAARWRNTVQKWGALALLPVYHPLWAMQCITRLMVARGQRVLSLTWHSSEMMPGGAPHVPDAQAAQALLDKVEAYLVWLRRTWSVQGATLDDVRQHCLPCAVSASQAGDWLC